MKSWSACLCFLIACGDAARGPSDAGTCDPLAAQTLPITIGPVAAAGTAPDGVLYVVTRDGAEPRVFVSEGDTLVRRRVTGSSFRLGSSELIDDTVSFADAQPSRLVFQSDEDYVQRMALVHDNERTYYDALTTKIELTVQPDSVVTGKPTRNLPDQPVLQWVATVPNGEQLLVTRPEEGGPDFDYRLFLGRDDALQELAVTQQRPVGANVRLDFTLNGMPGSLTFTRPDADSRIPPELQHDNGQWSVTPLPTGTGVPSGWRVYCL